MNQSSEDSPSPERRREYEEEEVAAARQEAARIGGMISDYDVPEPERPLAEAGQGESEGFELAEHDLEGAASHRDRSPEPGHLAGAPERSRDNAQHGDADHLGPDDDRSDAESGGASPPADERRLKGETGDGRDFGQSDQR